MHNATRVFLFFSFGYFVSYLYRGINIGFAPFLTSEIGLSAGDLGMLTSLYFLGFALAQIPAGAALDTWGPRRVNAAFMLVAAVGAVVFGLSESLTSLMIGRLLIGVGVSVCLGAAFQAMAFTFPTHRLPMVNGGVVAIGGLGGAVVGTPLALLLGVISWQVASYLVAFITVVVAGLLYFGSRDVGPGRTPGKARPGLGSQFLGTWELAKTPLFWQIVLFPSTASGVFYGVQSLWMKPYLLDVKSLPLSTVDGLVSMLGFAAVVGSIVSGIAARRIEKMGISLYHLVGVLSGCFMLVQLMILLDAPVPRIFLWASYGFLGGTNILIYAVLVETFPRHMLGRVGTTFNMLVFFLIFLFQNIIGWVVELWEPIAAGVYPAVAHMTAWYLLLGLQALTAVWFFASKAPRPLEDPYAKQA